MQRKLSRNDLDQILGKARSHNGWLAEGVAEAVLHDIYDLMKMGPTSANCSPARIVFVVSDAAKEKLRPAVSPKNVAKVMAAPVTAIIGYDTRFYDLLPDLFPHVDARSWFVEKPTLIQDTAFRNSSLQAAYFIVAARSIGLDVGPMSGFDESKVNATFWPDGRIKVNMLCSIGIGDESKLFDRSPRLPFEQACTIL